MNWLRLEYLEAADPIVIKDSDGRVSMVEVPCTPIGTRLPLCCGKMEGLGRRTLRVRDRRLEPAPTWLVIKYRRWKCLGCGSAFKEHLPDVHEQRYTTKRLFDDVSMSAIKRPFEDAGTFHAVEQTFVKRVFDAVAKEKLDDYRFVAPRVLGVDEKWLRKRPRWVAYDVENGHALELLRGRDKETVRELLDQVENPENVEVFCQDMHWPYADLAADYFPDATVVIDKFHVVKMANEAMDEVRKEVQKSLEGEDVLRVSNRRRLFLRRWDTMGEAAQDLLSELVALDDRLKLGYTWKEKFFDMFELPTRRDAEQAWIAWQMDMPSSIKAHFNSIRRNMKAWGKPIFNYFDARYTSGKVENFNGLLDRMNLQGYGYTFPQLRAKALLKYGNLVPKADLRMFMMEVNMGAAVSEWLAPYLEPDAHLQDRKDGTGWYSLGSGIPMEEWVADLEAGRF